MLVYAWLGLFMLDYAWNPLLTALTYSWLNIFPETFIFFLIFRSLNFLLFLLDEIDAYSLFCTRSKVYLYHFWSLFCTLSKGFIYTNFEVYFVPWVRFIYTNSTIYLLIIIFYSWYRTQNYGLFLLILDIAP